MNIGTINLATSRLSKAASSYPAETRLFLLDDSRIVADIELKFKLLTLTMHNEELLNLKTDRFIEMQIDKLRSALERLEIPFDPGVDPFAAMVQKKAMKADELVSTHSPNSRSIEVSLIPELVLLVSKYEFFKKLRTTKPELFSAAETAMSDYARKHRLALRLTSNAFLSDEERDMKKRKEKREANFGVLRKFNTDPDKIDY
ncbi:MAG: hypothetical protein KF687_05695 [Cyclobacteriaceae bacterium]|nr:hypothetical protein [Cyclobacteriaceae bacterium]